MSTNTVPFTVLPNFQDSWPRLRASPSMGGRM